MVVLRALRDGFQDPVGARASVLDLARLVVVVEDVTGVARAAVVVLSARRDGDQVPVGAGAAVLNLARLVAVADHVAGVARAAVVVPRARALRRFERAVAARAT